MRSKELINELLIEKRKRLDDIRSISLESEVELILEAEIDILLWVLEYEP